MTGDGGVQPPPGRASPRPSAGLVRAGARALAGGALLLGACYAVTVARRATLEAPSPTPILTDRHGAFLAQLGHETPLPGGARRIEYGYWPLDPPPERLVRATLALEDRRFWQHPGVDPLAVLRALRGNLAGGRRSGASTIAMQVARMQHPAPRSLWAKAVEAGTALVLTARYGREALLAQYFRLVPYGNGSHGIAHAARFYFDKPAADLGWAEIALLSAIPQAPALHNPYHAAGRARAVARAGRALAVLAGQGTISAEELAVARAQLAALRLPPRPRRPDALPLIARLQAQLAQAGAPGLDPADPRLRSSIDLGLQRQVASLARAQLGAWRGDGAQQVAVMVMRRDSREVLAAIGSAGAGTPGGDFDWTAQPRSPGSTMKPFLYALALQRGQLDPAELLPDLPDRASGIGNADGTYLGPLLPRQALANSRNVPVVGLLRRIGLGRGYDFLGELGLHQGERPPDDFGLALAIGALPTRLDRLMRAYGALADDGMLRDLVWYRGQPVGAARAVMTAAAARQVTLFLADPQARLPSFPRYGSTDYPFPVALKTGTSQGYRDAWTLAWSARFMVGVWVGRPDAGPMRQLGGAVAARLAQSVLLALHGTTADALTAGAFAPPAGSQPVRLCTATGRPATEGCGATLEEWLPGDAVAHAADAPSPALTPALAVAYQLPASAPALSILSPSPDSRVWRNPELPSGQNRLALRAGAAAGVRQVLWLVDGEPFAVAAADEVVYWPLQPGAHRFQLALPWQGGVLSRPVRVTVE